MIWRLKSCDQQLSQPHVYIFIWCPDTSTASNLVAFVFAQCDFIASKGISSVSNTFMSCIVRNVKLMKTAMCPERPQGGVNLRLISLWIEAEDLSLLKRSFHAMKRLREGHWMDHWRITFEGLGCTWERRWEDMVFSVLQLLLVSWTPRFGREINWFWFLKPWRDVMIRFSVHTCRFNQWELALH